MNRHQRRGAVKVAGGAWRREMDAKRNAARLEAVALRTSPEEARRLLAQWAAMPGRSQAEVDALNRKSK